jgi:hypothetical protein
MMFLIIGILFHPKTLLSMRPLQSHKESKEFYFLRTERPIGGAKKMNLNPIDITNIRKLGIFLIIRNSYLHFNPITGTNRTINP